MQRYGWQARQQKQNNSSPNSEINTNAVQQSAAINNHLQSTSQQEKNQSKAGDIGTSSRVSRGSSQYSQLERKGKITKISSISQNPLFQGMDLAPVKVQRTQQKNNQQQQIHSKTQSQTKIQPKPALVSKKSEQKSQHFQTSSQNSSQPHKQFSRTNRTNSRTTNNNNNINNNITAQYNDKKSQKSNRNNESDDQSFILRFQKTSKMSDSMLAMEKQKQQSLTQRPKQQVQSRGGIRRREISNVQLRQQEKKVQQQGRGNSTGVSVGVTDGRRLGLATQRKKYDLVDDIIFGNKNRPLRRSQIDQPNNLKAENQSKQVNQSIKQQQSIKSQQKQPTNIQTEQPIITSSQKYTNNRNKQHQQQQQIETSPISKINNNNQNSEAKQIIKQNNGNNNQINQQNNDRNINKSRNPNNIHEKAKAKEETIAVDTNINNNTQVNNNLISKRSNLIIFVTKKLFNRKYKDFEKNVFQKLRMIRNNINKSTTIIQRKLTRILKQSNTNLIRSVFNVLAQQQKQKQNINNNNKVTKNIKLSNQTNINNIITILTNKITNLMTKNKRQALMKIKLKLGKVDSSLKLKTSEYLARVLAKFRGNKQKTDGFNRIIIKSRSVLYQQQLKKNQAKYIFYLIKSKTYKKQRNAFITVQTYSHRKLQQAIKQQAQIDQLPLSSQKNSKLIQSPKPTLRGNAQIRSQQHHRKSQSSDILPFPSSFTSASGHPTSHSLSTNINTNINTRQDKKQTQTFTSNSNNNSINTLHHQNVLYSQYNAQRQNYQLRVQELKQIVSEYGFQNTYKMDRVKELQLFKQEIMREQGGEEKCIGSVQQNGNQKSNRQLQAIQIDDILAKNKLQTLTTIYFNIINTNQSQINIKSQQISKLIQNQQNSLQIEIDLLNWKQLYTNLMLKMEIQKQQNKIGNNSNDHQRKQEDKIQKDADGHCHFVNKKRVSWNYVNQENKTLTNFVRNWVKQQYYWALVKRIVAK